MAAKPSPHRDAARRLKSEGRTQAEIAIELGISQPHVSNLIRYDRITRPERKQDTRQNGLKAKYGMTTADYDAMLAGQGGGCAICERRLVGNRHMQVDHDHATGKVRAILCGSCNRGLGHFRDDPGLLERAIRYLRQYSS